MKPINKSQLDITIRTLKTLKSNCEEEIKNSLTKENKRNCDKVRLYQATSECLQVLEETYERK